MIALDLAFLMVFHPTDAYYEIKRRGKDLSIIPSIVILFLVLAVRYLYVSFVHAPLADIKLRDTNLVLEVGRILLPVLTIVVSIYAVTCIMYGETKIKTIFITVSYSFLPYLIITPLCLGVSQFIGLTESEFYFAAQAVMWAWIVLLVFFSIMQQNDYTLKKTLGVTLLSLIGVVLIWAVAIMILALSVQVVTWFQEVIREYVVFNT
jgi:hypothetical protein